MFTSCLQSKGSEYYEALNIFDTYNNYFYSKTVYAKQKSIAADHLPKKSLPMGAICFLALRPAVTFAGAACSAQNVY